MNTSCEFKSGLALFLVVIASAGPVNAEIRDWEGEYAPSAQWHAFYNWTPNGYSTSDNLTVTSSRSVIRELGGSIVGFRYVIVADQGIDVVTDDGGSITMYSPETIAQFAVPVFVGSQGQATMDILSGADVSSQAGYIGFGATGEGQVAVSGAGSAWANSGELAVGRDGTGTLVVSGGGNVSNATGWLGYSSGSSGEVNVSGAGSTWYNGAALYVGVSGSGSLTVGDGGAVSSTGGHLGRYRRYLGRGDRQWCRLELGQ